MATSASKVIPIDVPQNEKEVGNQKNNDTRPFPTLGITLRGMDSFVKRCGGRASLEGLTTTDVCEQFVKPQTLSVQLSYCDSAIKEADDGSVGSAQIFIRYVL
jgi:hypothetical protein